MSRSLNCAVLVLALALPLSAQEQAGPELGASLAARSLPFTEAPAGAVAARSWESLFPGLPRPGWVGARAAELGDVPEVVHLPNARFEASEPLSLPGLLTKPLRLDGVFQPGWFLLSMDRSPEASDRSFLDQEVGAVRDADGQALARWYLPNRTLAVYLADEGAHARLARP